MPSYRRSRLPWYALLLVLGVSLSACGRGTGHSANVLRVPIPLAAGAPDPATASSASDLFVDSLLYSGLVKFSPDLHVIPELAVSIPTISSGGRSYTFTVRQDARFADGHSCTAADVAYSLNRALRIGKTTARRDLGNIEGAPAVEAGISPTASGIRVLDRLTIRLRLAHPDADFLDKLAFPVAFVVDRRVVGSSPLRRWPLRAAGTGPWELAPRQHRGTIQLRPRPHFYGGPLPLRSLVLQPVRGDAAALALYRKGVLDAAHVPMAAAPGFSGRSDYHANNALDAYYALRTSGDAAVITSHLSSAELVQGTVLSPLSGIIPPAVPDYVSSGPLDPIGSRVPAAVTLQSPDAMSARLRQALGRQWPLVQSKRAAVRLRLVHVSSLLPEPDAWLRLVLPETNSRWYRRTLSRAGRLTDDPVTRMADYNQLEVWALKQGLIVPIASGTEVYLLRASVQGLQVTPVGLMPENDTWASVDVT